jgi:hypothetical protein
MRSFKCGSYAGSSGSDRFHFGLGLNDAVGIIFFGLRIEKLNRVCGYNGNCQRRAAIERRCTLLEVKLGRIAMPYLHC